MPRTIKRDMFYNAQPLLFERARELRNNMTEAERVLWEKLNKGQLDVRFKAQHPIHIFIADFYCHKHKLIIEIDGGIHKQQVKYDIGRTAELEKLGLRVIRFSNKEVLTLIEKVVDVIKSSLPLNPLKGT